MARISNSTTNTTPSLPAANSLPLTINLFSKDGKQLYYTYYSQTLKDSSGNPIEAGTNSTISLNFTSNLGNLIVFARTNIDPSSNLNVNSNNYFLITSDWKSDNPTAENFTISEYKRNTKLPSYPSSDTLIKTFNVSTNSNYPDDRSISITLDTSITTDGTTSNVNRTNTVTTSTATVGTTSTTTVETTSTTIVTTDGNTNTTSTTTNTDTLFFEIIFAGNRQTDPDMYYDTEQKSTRSYLQFDFAQPEVSEFRYIESIKGGNTVKTAIKLVSPIENQLVPLYGSTDGLTASKKFLQDGTAPNLKFKIFENFEVDAENIPIIRRKSLWYTNKTNDTILDGNVITSVDSIDPNNPGNWKKITTIYKDNSDVPYSEFEINPIDLLDLQTSETVGNKIVIAAFYEKRQLYVPFVNIPDTDKKLKFQVAFSQKNQEKIIEIPFNGVKYSNAIDLVFEGNRKRTILTPNQTEGTLKLGFIQDFQGKVGYKYVSIVPIRITDEGELNGDGISFLIDISAVDDYPNLTFLQFPKKIDIPAYLDFNISYGISGFGTPETSYVDIFADFNGIRRFLIRRATEPVFPNNPTNSIKKFNWTFNVKETIEIPHSVWDKKKLKLIVVPYSTRKVTDPIFANPNDVKGLEYPIETEFKTRPIKLTESDVKSIFLDIFLNELKLSAPKENKYISHLANFGDDNQILISSWENDNWTLSKKTTTDTGDETVLPEDEVKSIILKLYDPLPPSVVENSTLWITKILANPVIETVVLQQDNFITCNTLRGPNFNIETDFVIGQSTGYESLDTLIISSSASSSAQLVEDYIYKSTINQSDLNIQYTSGSSLSTGKILWDNFTHFSSVKERLDNFVYKVQLIELYETQISSSLSIDSISVNKDVELQKSKKNKLIQGFDGFEKFLYQSSSYTIPNDVNSFTWLYDSGSNTRIKSTDSKISTWYSTLSESAEDFDKNNKNSLQNNIPAYIKDDSDNEQFLLFINMIGQHFDIFYYYTKALEKNRIINYSTSNGITNKLLYEQLKSFGWNAKNLAADAKLWEYVLGLDIDGNRKYDKDIKQRNSEVWRRIVNNLPYLLKHKGTRRGINALLCCYGIPPYNLSIIEFGGPEINESTTNLGKYMFDSFTTALKFPNTGKLSVDWTNTNQNRKPDTIELFVKPAYAGNWTLISGSGWNLKVSGSTDSKYGVVTFVSGSTNVVSSSLIPVFNGEFFGIELCRTTGSPNYTFDLNVVQSKEDRKIFVSSTTASLATINGAVWNSGSQISIGSPFSGSVNEFRLWSTKLDKDRFYEHTAFPEMINGNHVSSSTTDLHFRLDFEYAKDVTTYTTMPNVDVNIYYSSSLTRNNIETTTIVKNSNIFSENASAVYSASLSGFTSVTSYPYQFERIEKKVVLEMPDIGTQRYSTNKVRLETQETIVGNTLFVDKRNTKRAYDNSPNDSNRLGLFFSPTKELNLDIAKSLGGLNLDNYIGDPRDQYRENYRELDKLRNYYFSRYDNRDIYDYINLVKLYEKNLFEDIKQLVPARSKATTGILIEPHILERNRISNIERKLDESTGNLTTEISVDSTRIVEADNTQLESNTYTITTGDIEAENQTYDALIEQDNLVNLVSDNSQYDTDIQYFDDSLQLESEVNQYDTTIVSDLNEVTISTESDITETKIYDNIEFGIFSENGNSIRTYYDKNGSLVKERIRVNLLKVQKTKYFDKYKTVINGAGDPRDGFITTSSLFTETILSIQPYLDSQGNVTTPPISGGEILEVMPVNGYLPTHYKYVNDLSTGLENSFWRGCKLTQADADIAGGLIIEENSSNPNTLRVNKFSRDTNEPILEVE